MAVVAMYIADLRALLVLGTVPGMALPAIYRTVLDVSSDERTDRLAAAGWRLRGSWEERPWGFGADAKRSSPAAPVHPPATVPAPAGVLLRRPEVSATAAVVSAAPEQALREQVRTLELRVREAELRSQKVPIHAEAAGARAKTAEARADLAETRAEKAEVRAEQAEVRAEAAEALVARAEARALAAATRSAELETRLAEALGLSPKHPGVRIADVDPVRAAAPGSAEPAPSESIASEPAMIAVEESDSGPEAPATVWAQAVVAAWVEAMVVAGLPRLAGAEQEGVVLRFVQGLSVPRAEITNGDVEEFLLRCPSGDERRAAGRTLRLFVGWARTTAGRRPGEGTTARRERRRRDQTS